MEYCIENDCAKTEIAEDFDGENKVGPLSQLIKAESDCSILSNKVKEGGDKAFIDVVNPAVMNVKNSVKNGEIKTVNLVGCYLCDEFFTIYKLLEDHVLLKHKKLNRIHNETEGINCKFCDKKCANVNSLRKHMKTSHPGEFLDIPEVGDGYLKFQCKFCETFFSTKDEVLSHVRVYHRDNFETWVNTVGRKISVVKMENKEPTLTLTQTSIRCNLCEYTCTSVFLLGEHRDKSHPGEFLNISKTGDDLLKFKCEFCSDYFGTKDFVFNHVRTQHNVQFNPWLEKVNLKKTKTLDKCKLLKHYYKKDGNSFKCNLCSEIFYILSNFKMHIATVHKEQYTQELEYVCDVCSAAFLRKSALNHHSLTHQPNVNCPQCGKPFSTMMSLERHKKLSCNNEVALKLCDFCGKGFRTSYSVKVHYDRVHLKLRPFKCIICNNVFKTLVHFQTHCSGKHNIEKEQTKQFLLMVNPEGVINSK